MNARFDICQAAHDAKLPPQISETPEELARAEWLYDAVERLIRGCDVMLQRRMNPQQGVRFREFALAVDEHVNGRLADLQVPTPSLGYMLIENKRGIADKVSADELLGNSDHSLGMLGEIAEKLLQPLVDDALIAQAEDADL